jgi:Haem-binding domain
MLKKILLVLLLAFIVIQFIRPTRNISAAITANDITSHYAIPDSVMTILKTACYDCHSNNTNYPWYTNIQPAGWWIQDHVNEGKKELNFSEFGSYTVKRSMKKLKEIKEQLDKNEMPLSSYTLIHTKAKLDSGQKKLLIDWCATVAAHITALPAKDSVK